jgi:predicted nucleotidyltransferase
MNSVETKVDAINKKFDSFLKHLEVIKDGILDSIDFSKDVNFDSFLTNIEDDIDKIKDEEKVKEELQKKFTENCKNIKDIMVFFQFLKNTKRFVF